MKLFRAVDFLIRPDDVLFCPVWDIFCRLVGSMCPELRVVGFLSSLPSDDDSSNKPPNFCIYVWIIQETPVFLRADASFLDLLI